MRLKKGKAPKRDKYVCNGGPWANTLVMLPEKTMVFKIGLNRGYYDNGRWKHV